MHYIYYYLYCVRSDFPEIAKELDMIESLHSTPHVQAVGKDYFKPYTFKNDISYDYKG